MKNHRIPLIVKFQMMSIIISKRMIINLKKKKVIKKIILLNNLKYLKNKIVAKNNASNKIFKIFFSNNQVSLMIMQMTMSSKYL